jgi:NAD(P)-dependent dehydrogenase (short-subunit alcohol dehydrogenase family)
VRRLTETIAVNVNGFAAMANVAMRHFLARGSGHLVGISSIAGIKADRLFWIAPVSCQSGRRARSTASTGNLGQGRAQAGGK